MKSARFLVAAAAALAAAACSSSPTTPTFPDAAAAKPNYNLGMMGSGQSITISEPVSLTLTIAIDP